MFGVPGQQQPKEPEADPLPRHPSEEERVLSHRELMFRELGFNDWQAVALAEAGADWHTAEALKKGGCPLHIVVDLLL